MIPVHTKVWDQTALLPCFMKGNLGQQEREAYSPGTETYSQAWTANSEVPVDLAYHEEPTKRDRKVRSNNVGNGSQEVRRSIYAKMLSLSSIHSNTEILLLTITDKI